MSVFRLAWKNIISKPINLVLSIILFALGAGLVNFLLIFNHQLNNKFESNLASIDMVLGAKGSPLQLILSNMYHIDYPTGNISIEEARPFLNPNHPLIDLAVPLSVGDNYRSFRIIGTNYNIMSLYNARVNEGKLWNQDMEVSIGSQVAENTGLKIGDIFNSSHGLQQDLDMAHDEVVFKVVGIIENNGSVVDQLILTNSASIWKVHDHEEEEGEHHHEEIGTVLENDTLRNVVGKEITSILVKFKSKTNFQSLSMPRNINENTNLQAAAPAYEINKLRDMMGIGTDALRALAFLIAFVSGLSIFLSLYKSMKDRKYELALMRVMGSKKRLLFVMVIIEGLVLAVIGWFLAWLLSHMALGFFSTFLEQKYQYSFSAFTFIKEEVVVFAASLLLGLIAAILPALRASNTDINGTLSEFGN